MIVVAALTNKMAPALRKPIRFYKDTVVHPTNEWEDHTPASLVDENDASSDINLDDDKPYPVILISCEDKKCLKFPYCFALIVKAFGKSLGFKYLKYKIRAI
nr:hypothetical protein CFP56_78810 [Quercus suber]